MVTLTEEDQRQFAWIKRSLANIQDEIREEKEAWEQSRISHLHEIMRATEVLREKVTKLEEELRDRDEPG